MEQMRKTLLLALALALLLAWPAPLPARAATKYQPCSLLTSAEVEAVLGVKVVRTYEDGESCYWLTASLPRVSLDVGRVPPGIQARDAVAQYPKQLEELKRKGGTVQVAVNTSDLWCARIVQPAGDSSPPLGICAGVNKGFILILSVFSKTVTGQQAKTLYDKAVARLR